MKSIKYLLAGALILGMSTPAMAQSESYQTALNPIISALEAAPDDPKAGKTLIKAYEKTFRKDEQAMVALANVYLVQHKFDLATAIADNIISNKKMNGTYAYLLLGDIAAIQDSIGNAGAAAEKYQIAISLDPHNVAAYERYARVYRHVNSDLAVKKLEELRSVEPNYPVEATAAEIMLKDRKYAEALKWYDKADRSILSEDNFYNYGFTTYILKKYDAALDVVKSGLAKFPNSEYIARIGMMAAVEKGNFADAVNFAQKMFAGSGKKVANDYAVYAKALVGNKQYDEALTNINKAMELDKTDVEPLKTLASLYIAQGDETKALEVQQEYLSKSKKATSNDWNTLAQTYVAMADKAADKAAKDVCYDKAMEVYETMITKFPSISDWIWLNESNVAYMKNDADKVAKIYEKVAAFEEAKTSLDATSKEYLETVYYGLGYYYSKTGNQELANDYYKKVLTVNPDNENAKKALGM
ncbi:hypothetical protein [Prevotella dentasini]|uniref:hypothetical protein n=1 Tax=Prevotella dentasini TaxID=589537 RepID=UPI000468B825|nr:hypothetical protein [Prevotella dentasini]